ncbi:MAG TPA: amidohydrolase [Chloroflexota bacterium]|nr:amidohydrolase [Chloroflexota bacterium]
MSSTLLTNGYIVTVDPERRVIPEGWILVEDDRIAGLGPMDELGDRRADQTLDLHGMVTLPGFINGHNHHWGSLFKNTGEGLLLEPWLDQVTLPLMAQLTNDDLRVAAYLGAIEQIRTGTTCSLNHIVNVNDEASMAAIIEPAIDVGVRQLVTKELRETPDPPFSKRYPAFPHARSREEELAQAEAIVDRWQGAGGLIRMGLAVESGANWMLHNATSDEIIRDAVAMAQRKNLKITNHCSAGTPWLSIREFEEETGGGDVDYLVRLGALTDNWVLIHVLWLKDREIDHIARSGASVVTNPVSNAYSCDGIAPLKQMFAAGVNVGLGTDGTYVNCSPDMVEQMKFAALIQNVAHLDPTFMTAERVIEMATINCAKALGMDDMIGSLETGKRADIVAFDLNKAHATVGNRPIAALVFSAHGTDVDTVLINGQVRLQGGELVGFGAEQEVLAEARRRAAEVIDRAGLTERVSVAWRKQEESTTAGAASG